jgi:hypothetical protein
MLPTLETLRGVLIVKWSGKLAGLMDRIDFSGLRDIRAALLSIEEMSGSYDWFASRMKAAQFERQARFDLST